MEKLAAKIAGEIALSDSPGFTMKKWREIFGISQTELAEFLSISSSTISDYESNRRKSPGIDIVRRYVKTLIDIDSEKGATILDRLREQEDKSVKYYEIHEFASSISGYDFAKLIKAKVVVNHDLLHEKKVYGFTLINSIQVILEIPFQDFPKMYGTTPERAFIFTEVSSGRSPMVVVRVSQIKPAIVCLHNVSSVDKLAMRIAEKERIPLIVTHLELNKILEELKKL